MTSLLDNILATKRRHIQTRKQHTPLGSLEAQAKSQGTSRGLLQSLTTTAQSGRPALIAEIKKASPSHGLIRDDFDPVSIARAYAQGGASAVSILTDTPYFQGENSHLSAARQAITLPVLRKDFMLDPYQIIESRAMGADCVLLILAALDDHQAAELEATACEWGMDVLIETHNEEEIGRALRLRSALIGINNRNLKTLSVSLTITEHLAPLIPETRFIICESGIKNRQDIERMMKAGAKGFLVGESLMTRDDPQTATRELTTPSHRLKRK